MSLGKEELFSASKVEENNGDVPRWKRALSSIPRNLNIYWLLVTGIAVWFLFVFTPMHMTRERKWRDLLLWFHLIGVVGIYLACIHNTLVTPSWNKAAHVWIGRVGLLLGFIGFPFGVYLEWGREAPTIQSIPITIGGAVQMASQVVGYLAIRRYQAVKRQLDELPPDASEEKELTLKRRSRIFLITHVACMLGLFVLACSIPAIMRLTSFGGRTALSIGLATLGVVSILYTVHFARDIIKKDKNTQKTDFLEFRVVK